MTDQKGLVPVIAASAIDPSVGRIEMTVAVGKTIAEIVDVALPGIRHRDRLNVRVMLVDDRGSMFIGMEMWSAVRPKAGIRVVVRLVPGKDALRSVLQIAVSIAAIALGQYWVAPLLGGGAIGAIGGAVVAMGVPLIGTIQFDGLCHLIAEA